MVERFITVPGYDNQAKMTPAKTIKQTKYVYDFPIHLILYISGHKENMFAY